MFESGARAPRPCFGARHSRPRAAQVVSDSLTILLNRLLVAKCAHVQAAGSARALSCLIDISCLWTPNPQTSGWLVPLRDANENLVTQRDEPLTSVPQTQVLHSVPAHHTTLHSLC